MISLHIISGRVWDFRVGFEDWDEGLLFARPEKREFLFLTLNLGFCVETVRLHVCLVGFQQRKQKDTGTK